MHADTKTSVYLNVEEQVKLVLRLDLPFHPLTKHIFVGFEIPRTISLPKVTVELEGTIMYPYVFPEKSDDVVTSDLEENDEADDETNGDISERFVRKKFTTIAKKVKQNFGSPLQCKPKKTASELLGLTRTQNSLLKSQGSQRDSYDQLGLIQNPSLVKKQDEQFLSNSAETLFEDCHGDKVNINFDMIDGKEFEESDDLPFSDNNCHELLQVKRHRVRRIATPEENLQNVQVSGSPSSNVSRSSPVPTAERLLTLETSEPHRQEVANEVSTPTCMEDSVNFYKFSHFSSNWFLLDLMRDHEMWSVILARIKLSNPHIISIEQPSKSIVSF